MIPMAVLIVSDRVSRGEMEDKTGPHLAEVIKTHGWRVVETRVVPDERRQIEAALREWSDSDEAEVIITAGGTGLGPRDVTPEATREVIERTVDGMVHVMRSEGLRNTPRAALSRGVVGIRSDTLIINVPGSPQGAEESLKQLAPIIPHAVAMIRGEGHPEQEKK